MGGTQETQTEGVWEQGAEHNIWNQEEIVSGWRELCNDKLPNLYPSPNMLGMIKSWRMKWARHGRREMHAGFWCESKKERCYWEDLHIAWRIIWKWISEKLMGQCGPDSSGSEEKPVANSYVCGNGKSSRRFCCSLNWYKNKNKKKLGRTWEKAVLTRFSIVPECVFQDTENWRTP
jgi:hypothetical protein